ncbi:hypothetical protein E2C01_008875 [Portunus trituberculatus]|uniref:Uncharacterized protein n=1 Tax=Portunus trituberculatus TaxID=210409 RepID=A0A5B7D5M3_PORTR|nr:hypothetical protein [Portunus trituberculatus]
MWRRRRRQQREGTAGPELDGGGGGEGREDRLCTRCSLFPATCHVASVTVNKHRFLNPVSCLYSPLHGSDCFFSL